MPRVTHRPAIEPIVWCAEEWQLILAILRLTGVRHDCAKNGRPLIAVSVGMLKVRDLAIVISSKVVTNLQKGEVDVCDGTIVAS